MIVSFLVLCDQNLIETICQKVEKKNSRGKAWRHYSRAFCWKKWWFNEGTKSEKQISKKIWQAVWFWISWTLTFVSWLFRKYKLLYYQMTECSDYSDHSGNQLFQVIIHIIILSSKICVVLFKTFFNDFSGQFHNFVYIKNIG